MKPSLRRRSADAQRLNCHAIEELERRTLFSHAALLASTTFINEGRVAANKLPAAGKIKTSVSTSASSGATPAALAAPFTPAQIDQVYGISNITFGSTAGTGAGQTIAIIDAYNNPDIVSDAAAFDTQFGLQQFNVSGGPTLTVLNQSAAVSPLPATPSPGTWDLEESLDVQWAHSVAPQANVVLFEANSAGYSDLFTAATMAAAYPGVSAVSMSFGGGEFSGETAYDSDFLTPAGHQGVTFLASTGDSAAPAGYPAYSPNVVAVGGTALSINSDGSYNSETGWNEGGGGISAYEPQPGYQAGKVNGLSSTYRTTPDVSMDASPSTGVFVLDSFDGGSGSYYTVGGTSLAAPLWAGLVSIVDQGRVLNGAATLDGKTQTLPALYSAPSAFFHDVTSGSNGFTASVGYDLVTGLGTPVANTLAPLLAGNTSSSHLAFAQQPTAAVAGHVISPSVTVDVLSNSSGNIITTDNSSVTLSISTGPAGATLSGTTTVQAVNGVATFNNLSLTTAGSYVLYASDGTMVASSASFTVSPAAAATLAFVQQPTTVGLNSPITPAVTVQVRDAYGNAVTTDSSTISVSVSSGPGALGGTTAVAAVNGLATFSNLILAVSGAYVLVASDGALTTTTSSSFNAYGPAAKLAFAVQPGTEVVGGPFSSTMAVDVEDAYGTIVSNNTSSITLSIASGPTGASIGGNITVAAVNGVATFPTAYLNDGGTYTLKASDGSLTAATSSPVIVAGSYALQTLLTFNDTNGYEPTGAEVFDSAGDLFFTSGAGTTGYGNVWELPAGATTPVVYARLAGGTSGFNPQGLIIDSAGDLFGSTSSGGASSEGVVYEIAHGTTAVTVLASLQYPLVEQSGGSVLTLDSSGNLYAATYTGGAAGRGSVIEIVKGSGVVTTLASVTSGQYPESNLVMDSSGNLYGTTYWGGTYDEGTIFELVKGASTLTTIANFTGNVSTSGVAPRGVLLIDPAGDLFGSADDSVFELVKGSSTPRTVAVLANNDQDNGSLVMDSNGNLFGATNDFSSIDTGTVFEIPAGTSTVKTLAAFAGVNGAATFSIALDAKGDIYGLNGLGGNSNFNLNSAFGDGTFFELQAPHLAYLQQPTGAASGGTITPAVRVGLYDAFGNLITADPVNVTLALGGATGGTLAGTATAATVSGIATFSNLSVTPSGTYTLSAADGLNPKIATTSGTFVVGTPVASKLAFGQQPSSTVAGVVISPSITVYVEDGSGNIATGDSSTVTIAVSTGPGGATGTLTATAVNGIATFNNVSLTSTGAYTLIASDGKLSSATSGSFTVSPAAAASLTFVQSPSATAVNAVVTPAVTVRAYDAFGNVATGDTSTVSLSIASGTAGALSGTLTASLANGIATFSNLSFTAAGTYTLSATDGSTTPGTSGTFSIYAPVATGLKFAVQPGTTLVGGDFTSPIKVDVVDQYGAVVANDSSSVTLSINSGPSGGSIGGYLTVAAVKGIATIPSVYLTLGGTYKLEATDGSLSSAASSSFLVSGSYALSNPVTFTDADFGEGSEGDPAIDAAGDVFFTSGQGYGQIWEKPAGAATFSVIASINPPQGQDLKGLIVDAAGNLYGSATEGGANNAGIVYEIPAGTHNVVILASLLNPSSEPYSGKTLTVDAAGDVFGAADSGGSANRGYVWEIIKGSGTVSTLASLTTSTGSNPDSNVVFDSTGNLYGTTTNGGTSNAGTIFELPKGSSTITTIYSFTGFYSGGGFAPSSNLLIDSSGDLLGTAGTTIFELAKGSSTITNLGVVASQYDSLSNLLMDASGNLFGLSTVYGSVFEVVKGSGTVTFLSGFDGYDGSFQEGLAIDASGDLYGINFQGQGSIGTNPEQGDGGLFELQAPHLTFSQQPTTSVAGNAFSPTVTVTIVDAFGNVVTTDNSTLTLSLKSAAGVLLGGNVTATLSNGTAAFSGLNIQQTGVYTLVAKDNANAGVTAASGNVTITPAAATHLVVAQQPSTAVAGSTFSPIVVDVEDAYGNLVTASSTVTLAVYSGLGTLLGTTSTTAVNGVATFSNLSIQKAGSFTLKATDASLTSVITTAITVTPAAAAMLAFGSSPKSAQVNANLSPAVLVYVEDAFGNEVTTDTSNVTLATASGPGALAGITTVAAVGGVATFGAVSLPAYGTYSLGATDGALTAATSNSFVVSALSTSLSLVSNSPSTSTAATALSFTATVTGGVPDGESISLLDTGSNRIVATGTLSGGVATLIVPAGTLLAGSHNLLAVYGGDAAYAASLSSTVTQTVQVAVTGVQVNGNLSALAGSQRSMVNTVVYSFSEPVNAGANAFSIAVHAGQTGTAPTLTWTALNPAADGSSTQWAVSFSGAGVTGGSIANGVYDITMNAAAVTSDANAAVTSQARATDTFYRLYGDLAGNQRVTAADYNAFLSTYNLRSNQAGYLAAFDAQGTGRINAADFNAFLADYNDRLSGFTATI